jgi:type IV pilus assembly protein PilW
MATDCINSVIFQITGVSTPAAGKVKLKHLAGGSLAPGNKSNSVKKSYPDGAEVIKLITTSYYISARKTNGSNPDTYICWSGTDAFAEDETEVPALCRVEIGQVGRRVIDGVERLKILYGQDTDDDGSVDRYVTADKVTTGGTWKDVGVIRFGMLVRSEDQIRQQPGPTKFLLSGGTETVPSDRFLRRVINQNVAVRNHLQ